MNINPISRTNTHEKYGTTKFLDHRFITGISFTEAPRHSSASGYGNKIPMAYMLHCADNRKRRVYAICYSNASTVYILYKGERLILDVDTEQYIQEEYYNHVCKHGEV